MSSSTAPLPDAAKNEPRFIQYYVKQGVFPVEQLAEIRATLEAPLPSCFRVNPNSATADAIKERLTTQYPRVFEGVSHDGKALSPPRELAWYPFSQSAWQLDCGKNVLGKAARDHDGIREFREFLLYETSTGNITRQEAVSMIPALLLDIQREHRVLDLCAAPGSKTSQVMENLGQQGGGGQATGTDAAFTTRTGFIVANDANEKRGYLLVHQLQRLGLETAVVTCHLGQEFPGLYDDATAQLARTSVFDRVICDVPCSGDGTIRKNKNIWGQWLPGGALSLHKTQLDLGLRAAALLRVGGLMVYSTCSFNPLENEAVVAEMLRRADGALELVDCSSLLPGLVRRPGMTHWQTAWLGRQDKAELEWYPTYDDVPAALKGMRINTGGFFVALLRKTRALPGDDETGLPSYEAVTPRRPRPESDFKCRLCGDASHTIRNCPESWNGKRLAERREEKKRLELEQAAAALQEPLHGYTKLSPEHWVVIKSFYGITDDFPHEHLCSRSDGATSVCLVNQNVQRACLAGKQLKVLNTGVRVFAKVQGGTTTVFRPTEDGIGFLLPFVTKRKLSAELSDLQQLLASRVGGGVSLESFTPALQATAVETRETLGVGPVILVLPSTQAQSNGAPFAIPVWLGAKTLGLLVDKSTQKQLTETLSRLLE
ncbi:hypothetical protein PINS_up011198 [Pythium insidiosum]|nr:hypothetical protein PINS_up011198 [Pythium insidiosum]